MKALPVNYEGMKDKKLNADLQNLSYFLLKH